MKKIFFVTILIFSFGFAFANFEALPAKKIFHSIQGDFGFSANRGLEKNRPFFSARYNFDFEPFFAKAAIQSDFKIFDVTLKSAYLPFFFRKTRGEWRFGANITWHFQKNSYFFQNDFLAEICARWKSLRGFSIFVRSGFCTKISAFSFIEQFHLCEFDFSLFLKIQKSWEKGPRIFFALGSNSDFRFPNFFCPQFSAGFAFQFKNGFCIFTSADLSGTDFLASAIYINFALFKIGVEFSF